MSQPASNRYNEEAGIVLLKVLTIEMVGQSLHKAERSEHSSVQNIILVDPKNKQESACIVR